MNFDLRIERAGTGAAKWDIRGKLFGRDDVIPMWVADMDFKAPAPVLDALKNRAEHGVFGYSIPPKELDEAIVSWLQRRHRWNIDREWLVYTPGVVPSLSMAISVLSKAGEGVVIQPPVYFPFFDVVKRNDRTLFLNPLRFEEGIYRMDLDHLENLFKQERSIRLLLLCSPHNPVGRVWTKQELQDLGELCAKYDVMVLSDEIHFDLVFPGHQHTPFAALSEAFADQCVVFTAPSKTFNLAGLQLSYMLVPNPKLRQQLKQEMNRLFLSPLNNFNIVAASKAYEEGEAWLEQLLSYLQGNAEVVRERIQKVFPNVKIPDLQGTYLMWLDFRNYVKGADELQQWANHEAKVGFSQGVQFGKEGEGFLRMNIACPRSMLLEALDRMESAAQALKNTM